MEPARLIAALRSYCYEAIRRDGAPIRLTANLSEKAFGTCWLNELLVFNFRNPVGRNRPSKQSPTMNFIQSIVLWCCILCMCPMANAEDDQDFLRGCALYNHGKGEPANYPEAFAHFMKAAERGHAQSQFYLGRMYHLESSIGIDIEAAKKWYHLAGEAAEGAALNNLGNIYRKTGGPNHLILECYTRAAELGSRESHSSLGYAYCNERFGLPDDPEKAMQHLQKAAELGDSEAASTVGESYLNGWLAVKPDKLKATYFFSLATKEGDSKAMYWLEQLITDPAVVKQSDEATLQGWREIRLNFRKQIEQEVHPVLVEARAAYVEGKPKDARRILDEALDRWMADQAEKYHYSQPYDYYYTTVIWTEAQVKGGRADSLWSLFLYNYLYDYRAREGNGLSLLTTRINIEGKLIELGQYGLLRQSLKITKDLIFRSEKIDVDAVLEPVKVDPDYQVTGAEKLPIFVNLGSDGPNTSKELIGGSAMYALENLADERLVVGDWESALIIAKWWEKWNDASGKTGVTQKPSFPGCKAELAMLPMVVKMNAFAALGLSDREAEAARQLIALNSNSYGGQRLHVAQLRLFELAVDQGRSHEIDLKELESLEQKILHNKYVGNHTWKFAKLVRARVIAKTRGLNHGLPLVLEVLEETKDDVLAPLRLEAFLVAAQISLEAGVTDGVAELLNQALESARSRGLLLKEMRVYELYVTYLIATHQYDAALEMQNRVIELIKALKLTPRLKGALSQQEEIISLQQKSIIAASEGKGVDESIAKLGESLHGDHENEKSNKPPSPAQPGTPKSLLALQPRGIRTCPIGEEASSVFLLSNLSSKPGKALLRFKSDQVRFTQEEPQENQITVLCQPRDEAGMGVHELDCQVDILGGVQLPIVLIAEGSVSTGDATVSISLLRDSADLASKQVSQWVIQQQQEAGTIAVVDAARLSDSNFALIPVYHHLGSKEAGRTAALRVIASEPTLVEGFAADGTLLFVDAQGNGSFGDTGDLIATEQMDQLSPVLKSGPESGRIALRYRPHAKLLTKQVEIRIETRALGIDDAWKLDVVDYLEP